jgi:hypothetical protein
MVCGTALQSDLINTDDNVVKLNKQYQALRDAVIEEHKTLFEFDRKVDGITHWMKEQMYTFKNIIEEEQDLNRIKGALADQLLLIATRYKEIRKRCDQQSIPADVINVEDLKNQLKKLKIQVKNMGLQFAIPLEKITEYYKIPIAKCQLFNDEILIAVKIPLTPINSVYSIFEPIPISYKHKNTEICSLKIEKSLVIFEKKSKSVKTLTGFALQACNGINKLCTLTENINDRNAACTKALFEGKINSYINQVCMFECNKLSNERDLSETQLPIIQGIGHREYIGTNFNNNTFISHKNGSITKLNVNTDKSGAFHIKLDCNKKLIQTVNLENITIIDELIPCFSETNEFFGKNNNKKEFEIIRILPAQWSELPDGSFESSLETDTRYVVKAMEIDEKWKEKIPTIRLQTDMEFRKNLDQAIIQNNVKTIYGSPFYQDLANLAIFSIIIILLLLLLLLLGYKHVQLSNEVRILRNMEIKKVLQNHMDMLSLK